MITKWSDFKNNKNGLLSLYKHMLFLRRFSEKTLDVYRQGQIGGFCHVYTGQEAVIAGIKAGLNDDDDLITSYRCHAAAISCGISPREVMAELTGKATGISKGKGGSMHMFDPEKHFWGGHGIVAAQAPLGMGISFANKYRGEKRLCATLLGDGASNAGQFFESLNMAAVWELPTLFIIENNVYGMGTAHHRVAAGDLYKRGEPFGMPCKQVDGMDFFAVQKAVEEAAEHIRTGKGPYLLEMDTYRYVGHSISDPAKYRTREDVKEVKANRDPITQIAELLGEKHKVTSEELKVMDKEIKAEIAEVVKFADESPLPNDSELMTEVFPG